ncbi:MAG: hypothetical protein JWO77_534 [Ilumatobacteraceae bacterium]|nr:hypothetical protein [Ilumatobacteraceae bacterium]
MGRMTKRVGIAGAALAVCSTLVLAPATAQAERSQASPPPALLDVAPAATTSGTTSSASSVPAHRAEVDTTLLRAGAAQTVSVDVVSDDLVIDLEPVDSGAAGWSAWDGEVAGDPGSTATIVRKGEDVAGLITSEAGTFRIRTTAPGEQVVQEVARTFPESRDDTAVPPATADLGVSPDDLAPDAAVDPAPVAEGDVPTVPTIDVLMAYTPDALSYAGGLSAMNSEIALAISTTNQAYADSGVVGRVRLAGTTALTENLTLSNQSLDWITYDDDGHSDQVHALRASTGADLVSVLTDDGTSCGLAWVLNGLTDPVNKSKYGFSTVDFPCAVDNLSFPHELGHNMGLSHDRYVDPTPTLYDYAVGYVYLPGKWRTIMAYNNQCLDQNPSFNCTRLPRFSNPDQTYGGAPLGRPSNGPTPADERRALNNTQSFVSSWRAKPAPFTSWSKFVAQQYKDFLGRSPSGSESSAAVSSLNTGAQTPQGYIDSLLNGPFGASYAPVTRLYYAYFVRTPDPGGLDYWVNKYKGGMKLSAISSNFAASSEFKTKYGNLTNRAFVNKIYVNLFERTGDASGVNYWTGKLDRKESTRGQVMIGFSESSEFKRVRAEEISVVLLYRSLLQRAASSSEFPNQVARLQGGTTAQRLILEIVDSAEYSGRVTK